MNTHYRWRKHWLGRLDEKEHWDVGIPSVYHLWLNFYFHIKMTTYKNLGTVFFMKTWWDAHWVNRILKVEKYFNVDSKILRKLWHSLRERYYPLCRWNIHCGNSGSLGRFYSDTFGTDPDILISGMAMFQLSCIVFK